MGKQVQKRFIMVYHVLITILTLWSVVNVVLMSFHWGAWHTEKAIADGLLLFFAVDYFVRLGTTNDRKMFLIHSAFDLMGIIPMHPVFALFRLGRLARLIRYHHLFYRLGLDGKWSHDFHRFIYSTGFIYLFSISIAIIVLSALLFSVFEHQSLSDSLWWAITTATTVGYGDDTPHTAVGKVIAVGLMFGGIGFIGLLTSTITDFFTNPATSSADDDDSVTVSTTDMAALLTKLDTLTKKVDRLQTEVKRLENKPKSKK
ncbi:potassium channel family protein [Lactiplantibacillus mudanjiangensis]|uniref:Potassium transport protein [Lactobacillus plantarum JDM1] n=1 Tax=Lactiplantibacillus mudanjiangensis TaxID=1296538 RepID=A0A660DXH7_9LACO|nr:potassium channel family protein [Lactiplantibacillus mudanjiangensis]VDG19755.1 potassium transport protein [Lactobacillus plantarum JDM1] [Lactiplantibacillus mudanjiangensis]VDG24428.1 potassium transport protein [Lactobacillus plantarum JDM1] [Lactiplantibacillus mudanjiangensis]VDG27762.1 potassium transport protein [Lactobacillus plantarum JDM1] [Lactiplantibacillus mudanjiangensis]VDG31184.1 potassium transport protein [Lactobacillus plantarum JDM1] [Lactiplantibacillus mudanjiangensi